VVAARIEEVDPRLGFWDIKGQALDVEQTAKLTLDILSPFQYLELNLQEILGGSL